MRANGRRASPGIACALMLAALLGLNPTGAVLAAAPPVAGAMTPESFQAFVAGLWPDAERMGVSRGLFDATFATMTPDPSVAAMTHRQPEEVKSTGAYLAASVTTARVAQGRAMLARWDTDLTAIERHYEVPKSIIVAIWGLETGYGASAGSKDVIRSMATLAALNVRPDLYRAEVLAALALLQKGDVRREDLRGSWAGAMGQPQFMPSSFATYAVDQDGDGRRDIWGSVPDALASIANFIRQQGWQKGRPWGFQVQVPAGFDFKTARASYADWTALGFRPADGAMPASGDGILLFPAGAEGPAFLVTPNYEVLKTYNFSDVYVLSVGQLADRIAGGPAIPATWPTNPPIGRDDRIALQARLVALGYPVDNREGRVGLALRDVIRSAQSSVGLRQDGNPTKALLLALKDAPTRR